MTPYLLVVVVALLAACSSQPSKPTGDSPAMINARLGLNYMQQGDYEIAMEKLKRSLEQDPDLPAAHHYIAALYEKIRNYDLADRHYRRALRLTPNDPALINNYGVFLCEQGRFDDAEEYFIEAGEMKDYERPEEAWQNAAFCAMRIPDNDRAMQYFRRALEVDALQPTVLYQMSRLSFDDGEPLQARAFLQRYEAIARHTPASLWLGVEIERQLDNLPAADDYARQLREEFPRAEETARLRDLD